MLDFETLTIIYHKIFKTFLINLINLLMRSMHHTIAHACDELSLVTSGCLCEVATQTRKEQWQALTATIV